MKVIAKTTKTYDLFDLTAEQYARVQSALNHKPRAGRTAKRSSPSDRRPTTIARAAKRTNSDKRTLATKKASKSPAKSGKFGTRPTVQCPIGGETIKKQGAWNHVKKHGKAEGMTDEAIKAAYEGIG